MISDFSSDDLKQLFGLFYRLVNRNSGMDKQVENLIYQLPYNTQQKILDVCENQEYAQYLTEYRDLETEKKYPESVRFPLLSVEDVENYKHSLDWIVEPLFSKGSLSVIVGAPGSLKTYVMLHAGLCIASGKQWLGFPTKQTPVLYVDEESGNGRIALRMKQILHGESLPKSFPFKASPLPRLDFTRDEDVLLLRDQIVKNKFGLVIIDAMIDVIGDSDENSANSMNPVLMKIGKLAKETKTAIVLIHHTGKDNKYRGTTAIPGSVDLMLYLKKEQDKTLIFTTLKARDIDDDLKFSVKAHFSPIKDKFWLVGSGVNSFNKSDTPNAKMKVIKFLTIHPDSTIREIEQGFTELGYDYDYDYIRMVVGKMEDIGQVCNISGGGRGKEGRYRVVD